jgi:putative aldouronate transport system permease protein
MHEILVKAREEHYIPPEKRSNKYHGGMVEHKSWLGVLYTVILYAFMAIIILICIVPMWHVLTSSLSDGSILLFKKGIVWWPIQDSGAESMFNWGGYKLLFRNRGIWSGFLNTFIYVAGSTTLGFVLNVIGGYTISRKSMLSRPLALMLVLTLMFHGGLIPTYMVIKALGMVGTRWALIIPGCTSGIFMVIMANAFRNVPESTIEAAEIDGAGHFTIMFQVVLPQSLSIATVIILNSVILHWNSWYPASIYVPTKRNLWPIQLWIKEILAQNQPSSFLQAANPDYNKYLLQYCVILIASLPVLLLFPLFLKYIEKGVIIGGVKE